jgi:hypothetical protein
MLYHVIFEDHKGQSLIIGLLFGMAGVFGLLGHFVWVQNRVEDFHRHLLFFAAFTGFHFGEQLIDFFFLLKNFLEILFDYFHLNFFLYIEIPKFSYFIQNLKSFNLKIFVKYVQVQSM